jgi:peptidoglycan/LPS O-acetylase OafA/YrhL
VFGALILALVTVAVVHRTFDPANSWWMNTHASRPHGLGQAAHDAVLLSGTGWLVSPLWSLKFEVAFSLLLPLYVFVARRVSILRVGQGLVLLALIAVGAKRGSGPVTYMPMFALGVLMAFARDRLTALAARVSRAAWWLLLVVSLLCLNACWTVFALAPHTRLGSYATSASHAVAALAAALIVFLVGEWAAARAFAESRPVQWLGQRSFSLYLTHEPLIVAVAFALGGHPNIVLLLAICTPAALVLSDVFFRLVEEPSHRLSQLVGRTLRSRLDRRLARRRAIQVL